MIIVSLVSSFAMVWFPFTCAPALSTRLFRIDRRLYWKQYLRDVPSPPGSGIPSSNVVMALTLSGVILAAVIWVAYKILRIGHRESYLPPGPPTKPILGNILDFPTGHPWYKSVVNKTIEVYLTETPSTKTDRVCAQVWRRVFFKGWNGNVRCAVFSSCHSGYCGKKLQHRQ